MKLSKGMFITVGVLIVAALAVVFVGETGSQKLDPRIGENLIDNSNLTKLTRIEVVNDDKQLVMSLNSNGEWLLESDGGFPVDATRVKTLVETLEVAKLQRLAAKSKKDFSSLDLRDKKYVVLKGDGVDSKILIGQNRSGGGQYIAYGDEEKAFLIDKEIGANTDNASWQLQTLVNIAPEKVKRVEFWTDKVSKPLVGSREKKEDDLKLESSTSKKVKDYQIKGLASALQNFSFKERHDPSNEMAKTALTKAKTAKVELFDGRVYEIKLGQIKNKDETRYYGSIAKVQEGKDVSKEELDSDLLMSKMMGLSIFEVAPNIYSKLIKKDEDVFEKKVSQKEKTDKKG